MAATCVLGWIIVPGEHFDLFSAHVVFGWHVQRGFLEGRGMGGGLTGSFEAYEHGWPWVYLEREVWNRPNRPSTRWSFTDGVREFRVLPLVGDLCVLVFLVLALAGMVEVWARLAKRPWQFSLSSLFLLTLAVALALGWWKNQREEKLREDILAKELQEAGFWAHMAYTGPIWLRKLVGMDNLELMYRVDLVSKDGFIQEPRVAALLRVAELKRCKAVALESIPISDAEMGFLAQMPSLEEVGLSQTQVTDVGLRQLCTITRLKTLEAGGTKISDAGVRHIASFSSLEVLDLADTAITDAALPEIGKLRRLQELHLSGTAVTDACAAHLANLRDLKWLDLSRTRVTGKGLFDRARLDQLERLSLDQTKVNDECLAQVGRAPRLARLSLRGTAVSDRGLSYLEQLPHLVYLDIEDTQVTWKGVDRLEALRPSLELWSSPPHEEPSPTEEDP